MEIIENILGGGGGNSIFGEAREALVGGCWGTFMSAGFLFLFFLTFLGLIFRVEFPIVETNIAGLAFPFICLMGVSAILSPFVGILFGANSGMYSMVRHVGCFVLYILVLLGGIVGVTLYF